MRPLDSRTPARLMALSSPGMTTSMTSAPRAFMLASAAASAPAPAREPEASKSVVPGSVADDLFEKPAPAPVSSASEAPAPSFTFGGANVAPESSGGSKKIFAGIAAAVLVVVGAYSAWSHFQKGPAPQPSTQIAAAIPEAVKPSAPPAPLRETTNSAPSNLHTVKPEPATQPTVETNTAEDSSNDEAPATTRGNSSASTKSTNAAKSAEPAASSPLMVGAR